MADDIDLRISADTIGLDAALGKSAALFGDKLRAQYESILNDVIGKDVLKAKATRKWNEMPFAQAHTSGGTGYMAGMFMQGAYSDFGQMGFTKSGNAKLYNDMMLNAGLVPVMPKATDRYGLLRSLGMQSAADFALSPLGGGLAQDYELLKQDWAKEFVKEVTVKSPILTETGKHKRKRGADGKLHELYTTSTSYKVDFEGMRDYAVREGLGRWKDPEGTRSADNFELIGKQTEQIDKTIDKIKKSSDKTNDSFSLWHDTLKGVLGTLTGIASINTLKRFDAVAAGTIKKEADALPNTRPLYDVSTYEALQAKKAGRVLGLGPQAIYNDVVSLANRRSEFKTLGSGLDVLFPSLLGVFNTINEQTDPMQAYKDVTQALLNEMKSIQNIKDPNVRKDRQAQLGMLIGKMGYGTMADIVGALSNPETGLAKMYPNVESLFDLLSNPYYSAQNEVEGIRAKLETLDTSIEASYTKLYTSWEDTFGIPFKGWWDTFLKTVAVPGLTAVFDKIHDIFGIGQDDSFVGPVLFSLMGADKKFSKWLESNDAYSASSSVMYRVNQARRDRKNWTGKFTNISDTVLGGDYTNSSAKAISNWVKRLSSLAEDEDATYTKKLYDWYVDTGLINELKNSKATALDRDLITLGQEYIMAQGESSILDDYMAEMFTKSPVWDELVQTIKQALPASTESSRQELIITVRDIWGSPVAAEVEKVINNAQ